MSKKSSYSGHEPNLVVTGHDSYFVKPAVRTGESRRHHRIPCRNVKACIKTATGSNVIVELFNISRGGIYFSSAAHFLPGALVSIATHYIEGGSNVFQDGRIVRMQRKPSETEPGEFAAEFIHKWRLTVPGGHVND
jgi:hypothetical protein